MAKKKDVKATRRARRLRRFRDTRKLGPFMPMANYRPEAKTEAAPAQTRKQGGKSEADMLRSEVGASR